MDKILFNCSTNVVGGAAQNAYNFIIIALNDTEFEWLFLVSSQVSSHLKNNNIEDKRIVKIIDSPSRNLSSRKIILNYEKSFEPDIVYTMAGPAYVNFKTEHIMGHSNAYVTHPNLKSFFIGRKFLEAISFVLITGYQSIYSRKANFFLFQTETARNSFCRRFKVKKNRTAIIPNALSEIFYLSEHTNSTSSGHQEFHTILCPAAAYSHKCLHIIPEIANRFSNLYIKFILTLPTSSKLWRQIYSKAKSLHVTNMIDNYGPFSHKEAPSLHYNADLIFVPSILETFSTSYLEAMAFSKPLIVADKSFSREICKDYATYFNPCDAEDAAEKIKSIINNKSNFTELKIKGDSILSRFGNQKNRFNSIKNILRKRINESK